MPEENPHDASLDSNSDALEPLTTEEYKTLWEHMNTACYTTCPDQAATAAEAALTLLPRRIADLERAIQEADAHLRPHLIYDHSLMALKKREWEAQVARNAADLKTIRSAISSHVESGRKARELGVASWAQAHPSNRGK